MQTYIGTKVVRMKPMTRQSYNDFRGWTLPADENGSDPGYLVEYLDGGKPNTADFEGYVSWSPKEQAENSYRLSTGLSFGLAYEALRKGYKVARKGWNGKGMWLVFVTDEIASGVSAYFMLEANPWIAMKSAQNKLVPWQPSQDDMNGDDWFIVE